MGWHESGKVAADWQAVRQPFLQAPGCPDVVGVGRVRRGYSLDALSAATSLLARMTGRTKCVAVFGRAVLHNS